MNKRLIYEMKGLYRDAFRVTGYEFGTGEKSLCIVGSSRGNEVQQLYCCSRLVRKMKQLEEEGRIVDGHKILILPSINPYSMNIQKRFWPTDNTDINRMFPGYDLGETTQRIADGVSQDISLEFSLHPFICREILSPMCGSWTKASVSRRQQSSLACPMWCSVK